MREFKRLADKTILVDPIVAEHKTVFGKGLLMPVFINDKEEVGLIIAQTKEQQQLGEIVPVAVAERLAKEAEASAYLSFLRNEDGLKSLAALRDWLDILEGFLEEDTIC